LTNKSQNQLLIYMTQANRRCMEVWDRQSDHIYQSKSNQIY